LEIDTFESDEMEMDGSCGVMGSWPKLQALVVASDSSWGEDADSRIQGGILIQVKSKLAC
jgi:hypothetical protein